MHYFTYADNQIAEMRPVPAALEWQNQEDFWHWVVRIGFKSKYDSMLGTWYLHAYFFESDGSGDFAHFVLLGSPDAPDCVIFVTDEVSLLQLEVYLAPALLSRAVYESLGEMVWIAEKAFRALHGHGHETPCPRCDPESYKKQQERLRTREKP